ncbi:hypothetical protein EJB05_32204, partial [Eragrostis curvula]
MEVMPSEARSLPDLVVGPCFTTVAVETSWPSTACLNRPSSRAPNGVSKIWEVFALAKVSFTSKNCSECKIRVGGGANSSALFPAWNPKKD